MLKKVFGIVSWFPSKEPDRTQRQERINRLFKQLNELWPEIDILVVAQNWKDFIPTEISNKIEKVNFEQGLGILKARQILREEFLKRDYDYIIMFDDDVIIECKNDHVHLDFMKELDTHPQGFCFIHGRNNRYHPYIGAQLNLCAISKFIYSKEPMVPIDPQKGEGYEDCIFACLLHHKYSKYEFNPPVEIRPIQFGISKEKVPSTWINGQEKLKWPDLDRNTDRLCYYIYQHGKFPKDWKEAISNIGSLNPPAEYLSNHIL